jgi:hypothetical protein
MHLSYVLGMAQGDDAGGSQIARRNLLGASFPQISPKSSLDICRWPSLGGHHD